MGGERLQLKEEEWLEVGRVVDVIRAECICVCWIWGWFFLGKYVNVNAVICR